MQSTLHITPKFGPRPKSEGSHIIQGNLKFCQVPELLQRQDGIDNRDHGLAGIFNGILGVALGGREVGVLLREVHTGRRGEGAGAAGVYGTGMVRFNTIQHQFQHFWGGQYSTGCPTKLATPKVELVTPTLELVTPSEICLSIWNWLPQL